uniref:Uncharacterized protein n=1 Tax=Glossina brevipalpis TaxID=37001 RepID=A0A1A9WBY5_9MUSC
MFKSIYVFWKAPKNKRATTITTSMSLPAECLVLSVSMPSLSKEAKRSKSAGPKKRAGQYSLVRSRDYRWFVYLDQVITAAILGVYYPKMCEEIRSINFIGKNQII